VSIGLNAPNSHSNRFTRLSSGTVKGTEIFENGLNLTIGGKDIELDFEVTRQDYFSGRCYGSGFGSSASMSDTPAHMSSGALKKPFIPLTPSSQKSNLNIKAPARAQKVLLYPVPLMSTSSSSAQDPAPALKMLGDSESYWAANWQVHYISLQFFLPTAPTRRKPQQKKHKTWDSDGYVTYTGGKLRLISDSGKVYVHYFIVSARSDTIIPQSWN
jgi:DNA repair and recombination protein RAD54B